MISVLEAAPEIASLVPPIGVWYHWYVAAVKPFDPVSVHCNSTGVVAPSSGVCVFEAPAASATVGFETSGKGKCNLYCQQR